MRFLAFIFFFIFTIHAYAQQVRVGYAKYASIKKGKSLKKDDTLSIHNTVVVKQDGEVHIINMTGWAFYLNQGTFDLDSCYQVYKKIYRDCDSVKSIIDTIFPNGLNGQFRSSGCRNMSGVGYNLQDENYRYGNIAFLNTDRNDIINVSSDTLTIYWRDPQKNSGIYIIKFEDMIDDVISYRICNGNRLHFGINDFFDTKYSYPIMFVTVYSEDGRKSSRVAIKRKN
jgi:hypothetical protein